MNGYLIDTNVISEFAKPEPSGRVVDWLDRVSPDHLFASVVTLGEIRLGIENLPTGRRRSDLERWLDNGMPAWFEENLLPVTKEIADLWGRLTIRAKRSSVNLPVADGLIAATALTHGLTIVTRNLRDFMPSGVELFNPWDDPVGPS